MDHPRIDWTKDFEGVKADCMPCRLVRDFRCNRGVWAIQWDFGIDDLLAFVDDRGRLCDQQGNLLQAPNGTFDPIIRNVPPKPVTIKLFGNLYEKSEGVFELRAFSRPTRALCETVVDAEEFEFTYTPKS